MTSPITSVSTTPAARGQFLDAILDPLLSAFRGLDVRIALAAGTARPPDNPESQKVEPHRARIDHTGLLRIEREVQLLKDRREDGHGLLSAVATEDHRVVGIAHQMCREPPFQVVPHPDPVQEMQGRSNAALWRSPSFPFPRP